MSALLESALDAERRAQAEAADAALRRTAADAISARQRAEALAAYRLVAAMPLPNDHDAACAKQAGARGLRHTSMANAFADGMLAGVELVLKRLAAQAEGR